MKCPLCDYEFDEAREACKACPMHTCSLKCCPKCGYAIAGESKILKLIKWIWM